MGRVRGALEGEGPTEQPVAELLVDADHVVVAGGVPGGDVDSSGSASRSHRHMSALSSSPAGGRGGGRRPWCRAAPRARGAGRRRRRRCGRPARRCRGGGPAPGRAGGPGPPARPRSRAPARRVGLVLAVEVVERGIVDRLAHRGDPASIVVGGAARAPASVVRRGPLAASACAASQRGPVDAGQHLAAAGHHAADLEAVPLGERRVWSDSHPSAPTVVRPWARASRSARSAAPSRTRADAARGARGRRPGQVPVVPLARRDRADRDGLAVAPWRRTACRSRRPSRAAGAARSRSPGSGAPRGRRACGRRRAPRRTPPPGPRRPARTGDLHTPTLSAARAPSQWIPDRRECDRPPGRHPGPRRGDHRAVRGRAAGALPGGPGWGHT